MSEFDVLAAGAQGMARERAILEIAARNVAAAQASTPEHQYHRLVAEFQDDADFDAADNVQVHETSEPVDALTEMVSMLDAQRGYEASASVFEVGKRIAERTIDLDRL
jgi:flagellar basal body rod protein FlgC